MKKHLYDSRLSKVKWFVRRFGAREMILKPVRVFLAPVIIPRLPKRTFVFRQAELAYFYHPYNMTWASERCIEVPIGQACLNQYPPERVLEVGNVLSHYVPTRHAILDKFEKGDRVINEDIISFGPNRKFDLVLSISTFEHIGFDDEASGSSADKIAAALSACRNLLNNTGKLVITVPIGYNPDLDLMIRNSALGSSREDYFKRTQRLHWEPCDKTTALACRFKTPFPYGNALLIAEIPPSKGVSG